jgi:hypothetical protein
MGFETYIFLKMMEKLSNLYYCYVDKFMKIN